MPIEPNERSLKTVVLVDDDTKFFELPLDAAYRWIHGIAKLGLTNTGTSPTFKQDDVLNYYKVVGIRRNGRLFKFNVPLRIHRFLERKNKGEFSYKDDPSTVASAVYMVITEFTIDFAEDVNDDFDIRALLQTKNLSKLELVIETGNKDDIASADAPTITSSTIELDIREFFGDIEGKDINDSDQIQMTDIIEQVDTIKLETDRSQFDGISQAIDLVANAAIRETALFVLDDDVRSNDLVTDVKFAKARPKKKDFIERTFESLNLKNITTYLLDNRIDGVVFIDWVEKLRSRFGLVTRSKSSELLRLLTSNSVVEANDTILVYTKFV